MASEQQRGLILIPNITGFVEFIAEVSLSHGEHIISELTERLIEANRLNLQLSELDGQALFFYRQGEAPDFAELMEQIVHWSERFHSHLNLIRQDVFCKCGACQNVQGLGLHVIGHYGEFGVNTISGKTIVIGKEIVLARSLLENSVKKGNFALLTGALLGPAGNAAAEAWRVEPHRDEYPVFGNVAGSVKKVFLKPFFYKESTSWPPYNNRVCC